MNMCILQTLGNHEFDHAIAGVVPFLETIESPVVVSNIDDSLEPTIQGKYKKSIVIDRYGRKIGVIGVILSTTNVRNRWQNEQSTVNLIDMAHSNWLLKTGIHRFP